MFTNLCVVPIVEAENFILILAADANAVNVRVDLLGSKVGGPTPAPTTLQTVSIPPFEVKRVRINAGDHTAFDGGYGAVQLTSINGNGQPSAFLFTAWCSPAPPRDANPASGGALVGTEFRIPHLSVPPGREQNIKVALTNLSGTSNVSVINNTQTFEDNATIETGQTYLWDSAALGRDVTNDGQVIIKGTSLFTCAAFVERGRKFFLRPLPVTTGS